MSEMDVYILNKLGKTEEAAHLARGIALEKYSVDLPPAKALVFVLNSLAEKLAEGRIKSYEEEFGPLDPETVDKIREDAYNAVHS